MTKEYLIDVISIRPGFYTGSLVEDGVWVRKYPSEVSDARNNFDAYDALSYKFKKKYPDIKIAENPFSDEDIVDEGDLEEDTDEDF